MARESEVAPILPSDCVEAVRAEYPRDLPVKKRQSIVTRSVEFLTATSIGASLFGTVYLSELDFGFFNLQLGTLLLAAFSLVLSILLFVLRSPQRWKFLLASIALNICFWIRLMILIIQPRHY